MSGVKFDQQKPRYELIPPEALDALADLYGKGAQKYGDRNWEKGMKPTRIFGALMRHAWAWLRGETHDPETGAHQMISVAWNAIAIYTYYVRGVEDDRPQAAQGVTEEEAGAVCCQGFAMGESCHCFEE